MRVLNRIKKTEDFCKVLTIFIFLVYSVSFFYLFHQQYYNSTDEAYLSDLLHHIRLGSLQPYSAFYFLLAQLNKLQYGGYVIAFTLLFFLLAGVFATKKLIHLFIPEQNTWVVWIYSWICNMIFPLSLINTSDYSGLIFCNVYHNSTYISMKPLAILSVYYLFKIQKNRTENKIAKKPFVHDWLLFTAFLTLSTSCKPNFTIGFSFVLLIILIIDFIKSKGKNLIYSILIGSSVLPNIALILFQQSRSLSEEDPIVIGFMKFFLAVNEHPIVCIIETLGVTLVVLVISYKSLFKDRFFTFAWANFLVNFIIAAFLYQDSFRLWHGNFAWGMRCSISFLFVASIIKIDRYSSSKKLNIPTVLTIGLLGAHIFCWLKYCYEVVFLGLSPW